MPTTQSQCAPQGDRSALTGANLGRSSRRMALRDAAIVADRHRGMTWPAIALKHKLSVRRCQDVVAEWRADGLGDGVIDPAGEVKALIDLLGQAVEDYARDEERTRHEGVRVHARREKIATALRRLELMQAVGLLPRHLGVMSAERELQQILQEVADLAREYDVPDAYIAAVVELSERRVHQPPASLHGLLGAAA